ncbi:hypothetical protein [Candidatus Deianiraea vastatrix]|uniref:Lipoprotein SmpA/OmlA domain-containing protein n=1 Tax=Candidatus Deianiraea vastatrix TaxID=2163644 RepID=A0A5B8XEL1_9RICK|nr:hypothetical protein [Candidatus Deianiraea vastatrix]QED23680.1 hypothetical protein Deia_00893 [Candidatus Deianiraea vastatrix]
MKYLYYTIITLLLLSCEKNVRFIGYPNIQKIQSQIQVNKTTKSEIIQNIGHPSFYHDDNTWYYARINGTDGNLTSFLPLDRDLLKITFSSDVVSSLYFDQKPIDQQNKPKFSNKNLLKYDIQIEKPSQNTTPDKPSN